MKTKQETITKFILDSQDNYDPDYTWGLNDGFDLGAKWALDNIKQILLEQLDKLKEQ